MAKNLESWPRCTRSWSRLPRSWPRSIRFFRWDPIRLCTQAQSLPYRMGSLYQDRAPTAQLSRRIGPNLVPGVPSDTGLFCTTQKVFGSQLPIHSSKSSNADQLKLLAQSSLFKRVPVPSYAWSRRRRRIIPGLGKCLNFVFSFDLNNKLNDTNVGSLVRSVFKV